MEYKPPHRYEGAPVDVWTVMTPLCLEHNAVNLGQGFPTIPVPEFVKNAAKEAISVDPLNQYSHTLGLPRLRNALAKVFSPLFERELDPNANILVTQGATEGTFAAFLSILNPGDEVILFEPFYDMYVHNVTMAGGVPVFVPLRVKPGFSPDHVISANDWHIDLEELERAITPKTKAIFFNTPHNPVGKVFNREELTAIANIVKKHDLYVLSDEVYERITYDKNQHVRIATLPGMWERTITVGSAGKTFSVTGWKVGWLIAQAPIIKHARIGHSRVAFCVATPLQDAVANSFEQSMTSNFFEEQRSMLEETRDDFLKIFDEIGLPYSRPEGSYFFLVNTKKIKLPFEQPKGELRDWTLCKWLTTEIGITLIPPSAFYSPEHQHLGVDFARVCFCKNKETLEQAKEKLRKLVPYIN